ncbi:adenosylcobinamide-phosphate synthase CbiB [Rhodospirillaceae bacterium SYSU D60014]|uniref:adenosylcobinamide-phosphate synthase CbiB n=1 Tax=Virgifigura deserti TaxID=2268457 RepID=UPI000E66B19A
MLASAASDPLLILLVAIALDAVIGDPPWLYRALPHPVVLIGRTIGRLDGRLNRPGAADSVRRTRGILAVLVIVGGTVTIGWAVAAALARLPFGWALQALIMSSLIAQHSLYIHVAMVARGLARDGLAGGRGAVAQIVGRDPESLDQPGVARAAIESLAENFSDGVVAPVFWAALFGLPGLLAYKAINTADSMIGHRTPRHAAFGWAAARLDDVANLIPARLAGLLITGAALLVPRARAGNAFRAMWRDAPRHRSPNAGWQEAAMAGALGLALAGPRRYGGRVVEDAWMGASGRTDAGPADIRRALRLYLMACLLQAALIGMIAGA